LNWTQQELATYRAVGDWEKLWEATVPLVKSEYGRLVRLGHVPEPQDKGDDHWMNEGMLIAGEAMRKWDPAKGAYSTYLCSHLRTALPLAVQKDGNAGLTARNGTRLNVVGLQDQRPGVEVGAEDPDDDGTYDATLSYPQAPEGFGDPSDEAERLELNTRLSVALAGLPSEEREALLATQVETQQEYAARIGVALITVKTRVARARTKVAAHIPSGETGI
jgi:RNA polymerase sigma factor (sigma-70 family)